MLMSDEAFVLKSDDFLWLFVFPGFRKVSLQLLFFFIANYFQYNYTFSYEL
jgi:hypothetical protein